MNTEKTNNTEVIEGKDALQAFFAGEEPQLETPTEVVQEDIATFLSAPTEEEPKEKPQPKAEEAPKTSNFYNDLVKDFIEEGDWVDGDIEIEKDGEIVNVPISELDFTPELFKQVKELQKSKRQEDIDSKYISLEGIDDTTKKMIELKKAGGDISELIKAEAQFVHPLKGLDLNDERIQEGLVRQKLISLGLDDDIIDYKINKLKEGLVLDKEADKIIEEVNTNFDNFVEQRKQEQEEQLKVVQEEQKKFKKEVTDIYRKFELKDTLVKSLVENIAKTDEYGLSTVDRLFFDAKKQNPELFAKVSFLLSDEEKFNEFLGIKIKNDVKKETVRTIFKLNPKTATSAAVEKKNALDEFFENK